MTTIGLSYLVDIYIYINMKKISCITREETTFNWEALLLLAIIGWSEGSMTPLVLDTRSS